MKIFFTILCVFICIQLFAQAGEGQESKTTKSQNTNIKPTNTTNTTDPNILSYTIKQSKVSIQKPANTNLLLKIKEQPYGVWINTNNVKYSGSGSFYTLIVNNCNIYFDYYATPTDDKAVIDERIKILNGVYQGLTIDTLEYRTVNGFEMIFLHCRGKYANSNQVITGYYKAYSAGNIRIYAVVTEDYYNRNKKQIFEVLNGIVYLRE